MGEQGLPISTSSRYGFNFEGASATPAAGCKGTLTRLSHLKSLPEVSRQGYRFPRQNSARNVGSCMQHYTDAVSILIIV